MGCLIVMASEEADEVRFHDNMYTGVDGFGDIFVNVYMYT